MNFTQNTLIVTISLILFTIAVTTVDARVRRCYTCRSRGPLGDCKDPFMFNSTSIDKIKGVKGTPCASQWCAKILEGKDEDHDAATERMCLQRPPEDLQERCSDTLFRRQKVFMCFCKGDLCNSTSKLSASAFVLLAALMLSLAPQFLFR